MSQFRAAPGAEYSLKGYGHLYVLGGGAVLIGIDPMGGTNPDADSTASIVPIWDAGWK